MDILRSISEKVATYISSGQLINSPTVQRLFEGYCRGVEELNSRMLQCEVLAKDSSSVTVALTALRAPSIYSTMSCLDSVSMREFLELCRSYQLIPNVEPNYQCYSTLENALSAFRTREAMAAQLRRLSREGSSEDKVNILRELVLLEPDNSEWKSQLKQAEHLFLPQVINRGKQAIIDNNLNELSVIEEILCAPGWIEEVPSMVVDKIRKTLDDDEQQRLKPSATALIGDLQAACQAGDIGRYSLLKAQWESLVRVEHYAPSVEENQVLTKCANFFADTMSQYALNHEFGDLLRQLYACVDDPTIADYSQCKYIYDRLSAYGLPIPEEALQLVENRRIEENNAIMSRKVKRVCKKNGYVLGVAIVALICGVAVWHSFFQERFKQELTAALEKEDFKSAELWVEKITSATLPYRKLSHELDKSVREYETLVVGYRAFLEVADKATKALEEKPNYLKVNEVSIIMSECQSKINCATAQRSYDELNKKYRIYYVDGLHTLEEQHLAGLMAELKQTFDHYMDLLGKGNYQEADQVYNKGSEQVRGIIDLEFYSYKNLSVEGQSIVDQVLWLENKHRFLRLNITKLVDDGKFEAALEVCDLYRANEQALIEFGKSEKFLKSILNAADMHRYITSSRSELVVHEMITDLNGILKDIRGRLADEQFDGISELLSNYSTLFSEMMKHGDISAELAKSRDSLLRPPELAEMIEQAQYYAGVFQLLEKNTAEKKNLMEAVRATMDDSGLTPAQRKLVVAVYEQFRTLNKITDYQKSNIYSTDNAALSEKAFIEDMKRYAVVRDNYARYFRELKASLKEHLNKYLSDAKFYICFEDSRGIYHERRGNIEKLREEMKSLARKPTGPNILIKLGDESILIDGQNVTIRNLKHKYLAPKVYKNVKFVAPSEMTWENVWNSFDEDSISLRELATAWAELPQSIFEQEFYKLFDKIKYAAKLNVDKRLELTLTLLKPFHSYYQLHLDSTEDGSSIYINDSTVVALRMIVAIYERLNRIYENVVREKEVYSAKKLNRLYSREVEDTDFSCVLNYCQAENEVQQFREFFLRCKYSCIGVARFSSDKTEFIAMPGAVWTAGEVWGFDENGRTFVAGETDGSKIWLNGKFLGNRICVVFVAESTKKLKTVVSKYLRRLDEVLNHAGTIFVLPEFFPQELQR